MKASPPVSDRSQPGAPRSAVTRDDARLTNCSRRSANPELHEVFADYEAAGVAHLGTHPSVVGIVRGREGRERVS